MKNKIQEDAALAYTNPLLAIEKLTAALLIDSTNYEALVLRGRCYFVLNREGDKDRASKDFNAALEIVPNDYSANFYLAKVYIRQQKYDLAIKHLLKAMEARKDLAAPHCTLAEIYHQQGRYQKALEQCELVFKKDTKRSFQVVTTQLKNKIQEDAALPYTNPLLAIEKLTAALSTDSTNYDALVLRGRCYFVLNREGDKDRVLKDFNAALEIMPNDYSANFYLAKLYRRLGKNDLAIKHLLKAMEARKDLADPHFTLAEIYHQQGHYQKALEQCELVFQKDTKKGFQVMTTQLKNKINETIKAETKIILKAQYLEASRDEAKAILENREQQLEKLKQEGKAYQANQQYDKAIQCYETIVQMGTKNAEIHRNMGYCYYKLKDHKQSLHYHRLAAVDYPNNFTVQALMGYSLYFLKDYVQAESQIAKAISLCSTPAEPYRYLAVTQEALGKIPQAYDSMHLSAKHFEESLSVDKRKDNPVLLTYVKECDRLKTIADTYAEGLAFYHKMPQPDFESARKRFEKVTQLNPNCADAWSNLAWCYRNLPTLNNHMEQAAQAETKAIKPDIEIIHQLDGDLTGAVFNSSVRKIIEPKAVKAKLDAVKKVNTTKMLSNSLKQINQTPQQTSCQVNDASLESMLFGYTQCIQTSQNDPDGYIGRAITYHNLGKLKEAKTDLVQASKIAAKNDPRIPYYLSYVDTQLGNYSEAWAKIHETLALQSNYPGATELKEKIQKETELYNTTVSEIAMRQVRAGSTNLAILLSHESRLRNSFAASINFTDELVKLFPERTKIDTSTEAYMNLSIEEKQNLHNYNEQNQPPRKLEFTEDAYTEKLKKFREKMSPLAKALTPEKIFHIEAGEVSFIEYLKLCENEPLMLENYQSKFRRLAHLTPEILSRLDRGSVLLTLISAGTVSYTIGMSNDKINTALHQGTLIGAGLVGGGMAASIVGAGAASAVCGPGAPVCAAVILGAAGVLGSIAGTELGELTWQVTDKIGKLLNSSTPIVLPKIELISAANGAFLPTKNMAVNPASPVYKKRGAELSDYVENILSSDLVSDVRRYVDGFQQELGKLVSPINQLVWDAIVLLAGNEIDFSSIAQNKKMSFADIATMRGIIAGNPRLYTDAVDRMHNRVTAVKQQYAAIANSSAIDTTQKTLKQLVNMVLGKPPVFYNGVPLPIGIEFSNIEKLTPYDIKLYGEIIKKFTPADRKLYGEIKCIYVVMEDGSLIVTPEYPEFREKLLQNFHVDLARGQPVLAAGVVIFDIDGKMILVNNNSGHYKPEGEHLSQLVTDIFEKEGFQEVRGKYRDYSVELEKRIAEAAKLKTEAEAKQQADAAEAKKLAVTVAAKQPALIPNNAMPKDAPQSPLGFQAAKKTEALKDAFEKTLPNSTSASNTGRPVHLPPSIVPAELKPNNTASKDAPQSLVGFSAPNTNRTVYLPPSIVPAALIPNNTAPKVTSQSLLGNQAAKKTEAVKDALANKLPTSTPAANTNKPVQTSQAIVPVSKLPVKLPDGAQSLLANQVKKRTETLGNTPPASKPAAKSQAIVPASKPPVIDRDAVARAAIKKQAQDRLDRENKLRRERDAKKTAIDNKPATPNTQVSVGFNCNGTITGNNVGEVASNAKKELKQIGKDVAKVGKKTKKIGKKVKKGIKKVGKVFGL
ncbi:MAG: tetratricopeptide repeat protein [Legionellales bacterium]|nr:tetratricopeptide repeat protein [Legionellales bacterium]